MDDVVLAIDLGGTKVEAALVDRDGVISSGSRRRSETGPGAGFAELRDALGEVALGTVSARLSTQIITAVGIGSAGPLNSGEATVSPLNLPVHDFPIVAVVREVVGDALPIRLALDGTCIALAESRFGAASGVSNSVSMVVSTGVGGGIVIDGVPIGGEHGNAGHIGQLRVAADESAEDPTAGTLESVASGPATVAWARGQRWSGQTGMDLPSPRKRGTWLHAQRSNDQPKRSGRLWLACARYWTSASSSSVVGSRWSPATMSTLCSSLLAALRCSLRRARSGSCAPLWAPTPPLWEQRC